LEKRKKKKTNFRPPRKRGKLIVRGGTRRGWVRHPEGTERWGMLVSLENPPKEGDQKQKGTNKRGERLLGVGTGEKKKVISHRGNHRRRGERKTTF